MQQKNNIEEWYFLLYAIISAMILTLVYYVHPEIMPFTLFSCFSSTTSPLDWLQSAIPLFIWVFLLNTCMQIILLRKKKGDPYWFLIDAIQPIPIRYQIGRAWMQATTTGVLEEVTFRWLVYGASIPLLLGLNFFFFGFAGYGIVKLLYVNFFNRIADIATLEFLHPYLFAASGWTTGAAVLSANGLFRNGHSYQGIFGLINSWFTGMFLFWIFFHHGLLACMLIHIIHNLIVYHINIIASIIGKRILSKS